MFGRTKVSKPKSDAEIITEAVKEAQRQYERRERGRRRRERFGRFFGWFREAPSWLKTLLTVGLILLVALIADGIRRESAEFKANLVAFSGQVWVQKSDSRNWIAPEPNMALRDRIWCEREQTGRQPLFFLTGVPFNLSQTLSLKFACLTFSEAELVTGLSWLEWVQ